MLLSVKTESRDLALDLHQLLAELDVARWRSDLEGRCRAQLGRIEARLRTLRANEGLADERLAALRGSVDRIALALPGSPAAEELGLEWAELRARLQPAYEEMAAALRALAVHVPTRRPTNYARNVLHMGGAALALFLVHRALPASWLLPVGLSLGLGAWSLELSRRRWSAFNAVLMRILGVFAHPHEGERVNSATWYCTALALLALMDDKSLVLVAIAVLGFADPAAALVGRRYGSIKLVNGRSLQGSLAFVVVGTLATALVLGVTRPELGFGPMLVLALAAGLLGALAELFSLRVDDNLSVPVAAAAGAGLAGLLLA